MKRSIKQITGFLSRLFGGSDRRGRKPASELPPHRHDVDSVVDPDYRETQLARAVDRFLSPPDPSQMGRALPDILQALIDEAFPEDSPVKNKPRLEGTVGDLSLRGSLKVVRPDGKGWITLTTFNDLNDSQDPRRVEVEFKSQDRGFGRRTYDFYYMGRRELISDLTSLVQNFLSPEGGALKPPHLPSYEVDRWYRDRLAPSNAP